MGVENNGMNTKFKNEGRGRGEGKRRVPFSFEERYSLKMKVMMLKGDAFRTIKNFVSKRGESVYVHKHKVQGKRNVGN